MALSHRLTTNWLGAIGGLIGGVFAPVSCFVSCQANSKSDRAISTTTALRQVAGGHAAGRDVIENGLSEEQVKQIAAEVIRLQVETTSDMAAMTAPYYARTNQFRLEEVAMGDYGRLLGHIAYDGNDPLQFAQIELAFYSDEQTRVGSGTLQFHGVQPRDRFDLAVNDQSHDLSGSVNANSVSKIRIVSVMAF